MKEPRVPKHFASAEIFDFWQETPAGSGNYGRVAGCSFSRLWHDYAARGLGPAWIITARMKQTDAPNLELVVARSKAR